MAVLCGVCAVIIVLYLFLQTALGDANLEGAATNHLAQPMQKIALNHMQLVALAASFPLEWPAAVESLFTTFGVLGDAGDYIFNPACGEGADATKTGSGGLFFQKQLMVLMVPFGAISSAVIFWSMVWIRSICSAHKRRRKSLLVVQQYAERKRRRRMGGRIWRRR